MKKNIIFLIDTGCAESYLKKELLKSYSEDEINKTIKSMILDNEITIGKVSGWVVVNKFSPNTAEKLKKE